MQDSELPETVEGAEGKDVPQKRVEIQKVYIKDVSYEAPGTPQVFTAEWAPQVSQEMANSHTQLGDVIYEVCLRATITVKIGNKVAYLVEINQAGIFNLIGYEPKEIEHIIAVHCPTVLFPFVREAAADMSTRAGFPQLMLQFVDFAGVYHQYLQQKTAEAQAELDSGAPSH